MINDSRTIRFVPETHTYWLGDTQFRSVTTLVKTVVPEFDKQAISIRSAIKKGVSQEDLLAEWDRKAQASLEKGVRVHAYVEDVLNGVTDLVLDALNERLPEMSAFDRAWQTMQTQLQARVIDKESVVWDEYLLLAGRVDVILAIAGPGEPRETPCVFDWKTGKFAVTNRFEKLLPPFQDLDHCERNVYSLQTSLYRVLLERMTGKQYGPAYLVHLKDTGDYQVYRSLDLRERVSKWAEMSAIFS